LRLDDRDGPADTLKEVAVAWAYLFVAGLLEIVWAYSMKLSDGFTRPGYSAITIVAMILSFGLLALAMKSLPLGTAYTVWTGIGAVGAFILGVVWLGEAATLARLAAAALIIAGLILMKVSTPA
jgi:quaternary ammonium compound-resistance protein SugE